MKKLRMSSLLAGAFIFLFSQALVPCTTFCFQADGHWVFGRNYDWSVEHCRIMVNKRGVSKQGFAEGSVAKWTSKYGSVTFNQYGREFPLGGMNEAGLVVECMWLDATELPHVDSRPALNSLQWIQYQLDTADCVADVIASDGKIRIAPEHAQPLHFLICDAAGHAVVVEFLAGEMVARTAGNLPRTVLTNNTYAHSVGLLNALRKGEADPAFLKANNSLQRFVRAARGVVEWKNAEAGNAVDHAFDILERVSMKRTIFSVVYDPGRKRIHFFTRAATKRRFFRFDAFDFSCATPVQILDTAADLQGDVTEKFVEYSLAANLELVKSAFAETDFLKDTPASVMEKIAGLPRSFTCAKSTRPR